MARSFGPTTTGDVVTVTQAAILNGQFPFSFSMWFNLNAAADSITFFSKDFAPPNGIGSLYFHDASTLRFDADGWSGSIGKFTWPWPTLSVWHHALLTYPYLTPADRPSLYIDGVLQILTVVTAPTGTSTAGDAQPFTLGYGGNNDGLDGAMSDVALWNGCVLNQRDAALLAAGASPLAFNPKCLAFYLPMRGDFSPEPDLSGNGNTGAVTGTSVISDPTQVANEMRYFAQHRKAGVMARTHSRRAT